MVIPDDRTRLQDPNDTSTGSHKPIVDTDPLIGKTLNHAYHIEGKIGEGGMGVVYRATQIALGRHVAVKTIRLDNRLPSTALERFFREAKLLSQLNHPHIVHILDFGSETIERLGHVHFMVMEYLHGETLEAFVEKRGPLPGDLMLDLVEQVCSGVAAAHQSQVIHRDLKPSNIFVLQVTSSPRPVVKILDFGLGKMIEPQRDSKEQSLTREGAMMGTLCYSAPEQLEGSTVDTFADIYSLGAVVYFMLAARPPYTDEGLRATLIKQLSQPPEPLTGTLLNPEQQSCTEAVIRKAMCPRAEERYATAGEFYTRLVKAIHPGETIADCARTSSQIQLEREPTEKPTRRHVLTIGASALLLGGAGLAYWLNNRSKPPKGPGATAPGVTNDEILLGMSGPFSGIARELGRGMQVGIEAYLERVNEAGGVHGRKLHLVALDDRYEPELAAANMKKLLDEHEVFAFLGNVGTPTTEAALPIALEHKRVFFGAFTGGRVVRNDPPDRYVFNYRASYEEETEKIVNYLIKLKRIPAGSIAVFAQQDSYGESGFQGVAKALRDHGRASNEILKVGYPREKVDVAEAVETIVKARDKVRAIVMVATYKPAARFIQKVKDAGLDVIFTNVSFVGSVALAEELVEKGAKYPRGVIVTQVVPPMDSHASGVLRYREALRNYAPNESPSFISLEGYIAAEIFVKGVENAGPGLTSETLVEGLERIDKLDLGIGTEIRFAPSDHQASHRVWGTMLDEKGRFGNLELE
jgi:serine/threonine protein kinase